MASSSAFQERYVLPPNAVIGTSENLVANNSYITQNGSATTLTLPSVSKFGDLIYVIQGGAGLVKIAQLAAQEIHLGNMTTTNGTMGYVETTAQYDSFVLQCVVANTEWAFLGGPQGGITVA